MNSQLDLVLTIVFNGQQTRLWRKARLLPDSSFGADKVGFSIIIPNSRIFQT